MVPYHMYGITDSASACSARQLGLHAKVFGNLRAFTGFRDLVGEAGRDLEMVCLLPLSQGSGM